MRNILKEYLDKNFALIEMKKLIKYKGKDSGRPLVKEEEGFYEKAEKKQIEPPKKLWNDGDESNDSIGGWTKSSKRNDEINATKKTKRLSRDQQVNSAYWLI